MKLWHVAFVALFVAACTAGAGGGAVWAVVAAIVATIAFVVACSGGGKDDTNVYGCLQAYDPDATTNACLSTNNINTNNNQPDLGVCLSPLPPDLGPRDAGTDADFGPSDAGGDAGDMGDGGELGEVGAAPTDKKQLLAKLRARLPEDVVTRIESEDDDLA